MAASPLPRWAPTPSPTRPLRSSSSGEVAKPSWTSRVLCPLTSIIAPHNQPAPPAGSPANAEAGNLHRYNHDHGTALDGVEAGDQHEEDRRVFLTWEDLSVTATDGRVRRAVILEGLSGHARPGEVLALMGPSGCGKTTLLDALAGRLGSDMKRSGEVLINGRRERLAFGTSAYVTQDNMLMATLTVREAVRYSAQILLPDSVEPAEKRARADAAIQAMGLGSVADGRIGGRVCKGISSGQRRRVSICVEMLASPALVFLDEPTSGLDSAASYHVMRRIAGLARREGTAVVAAVHQPCTEVFELFHGLCLLANGRTVYFGAASGAAEFFNANGFPCPIRRNPSDHFLRIINKDFEEESEEISTVDSPSAEEAIQILVESFGSLDSLHNKKQTATMQKECLSFNPSQCGSLTRKSQAGFLTKLLVLTKRSFVNMHRDMGYYWLRFAIYIGICLSIGTIFYNVGFSFASIQARASMLMFTSTLLTMMAIGGFPSFVEDMKIFRRERLNGHYGATAFVISNTVSSIPYLGLISIIPGAIAYYLTGLQRETSHFVYFAAILWACTMLVEGLMMIVAAIVPDFLLGIITGSGIQGLLMLNAGFFQLPNDLPKPIWKYPMYFISYHKYATQGLYKNEFEGLAFDGNLGEGRLTINGDYIIRNNFQVEMGYSKWVDLAILCAMVVVYRVLFLVVVKVVEMTKPKVKCLTLKV